MWVSPGSLSPVLGGGGCALSGACAQCPSFSQCGLWTNRRDLNCPGNGTKKDFNIELIYLVVFVYMVVTGVGREKKRCER